MVEVLPAPFTKQSIIEKTFTLMKDIGQSPIRLQKPINGFAVNRLQYALIMEAWRLVEDGVMSPEDIDTAISQGLGLRYSFIGPFEVMHLNANGIREYCELYGENIKRVCDTQTPARQLNGPTLDVIQCRWHSCMCTCTCTCSSRAIHLHFMCLNNNERGQELTETTEFI